MSSVTRRRCRRTRLDTGAVCRHPPTFDGLFSIDGKIPGGTEVQIAGRGSVPSDAEAAVINLTVTEGTGPGYAPHTRAAPYPTRPA